MRELAALLVAALAPTVVLAQRQQCTVSPVPDPLPIAMQLVDSVALAAALSKGVVVPTTFSLWYDKSGQLTHVLALVDSLVVSRRESPNVASLARAALGRVIADAAFQQDSGRAMSVRLTIAIALARWRCQWDSRARGKTIARVRRALSISGRLQERRSKRDPFVWFVCVRGQSYWSRRGRFAARRPRRRPLERKDRLARTTAYDVFFAVNGP